jgi:hypothetical protein
VTPPVRNEAPAAAFERRCARAEALARTAADDEPLRFAAGLLRTQARIAAALAEEHAMRALSGRLGEDFARIREPLLEVARFATREGPEPLAREARAREREDADAAAMRLLAFWNGGRSSVEDYLSRAMLRPYLEHLRAQRLARIARARAAAARSAAAAPRSARCAAGRRARAPRATSPARCAGWSGRSGASCAARAARRIPCACRASRAPPTRACAWTPARPAAAT